MTDLRPVLGDFHSIVCFKSVIAGIEDTLGPDGAAVVFTHAGKLRGQRIAHDLGVTNSPATAADLTMLLDSVLGQDGSRIAGIHAVTWVDGRYVVDCFETVCSAGEPQGSDRKCTFVLGAVWGALEAITGQALQGEHTLSVLQGAPYDRLEFSPL